MPCYPFKSGNASGFICVRGRRLPSRKCGVCGAPADLVCDYRLKCGLTCDKPLCTEHAVSLAPGVDVCPHHPAMPAIADLFDGDNA